MIKSVLRELAIADGVMTAWIWVKRSANWAQRIKQPLGETE